MSSPTADVSCRVAWADDAPAIADVQVRTWQSSYADLLPAEALELDAVTGPASDPDCDPISDAELLEFNVDPGDRGAGHGSRLLQAAVDTMRADRFDRAVLWAIATDDGLRRFLTDAGWAPDSAHRELDLDGEGTTVVKQVRLHTAFS
jgi:GNAT superfamily N-acetyltransferase